VFLPPKTPDNGKSVKTQQLCEKVSGSLVPFGLLSDPDNEENMFL
jgi:hypothetical protein